MKHSLDDVDVAVLRCFNDNPWADGSVLLLMRPFQLLWQFVCCGLGGGLSAVL